MTTTPSLRVLIVDDHELVREGLVGAFAVVAVAGIVQANLAYVPETSETKKRDLPPVSGLKPVVAPLARGEGADVAGVTLGLAGVLF